MATLLKKWMDEATAPFFGAPLANVWLGVSVENQKWADQRIPLLLDTPARVRFLSCEPLLGPVDLEGWMPPAHTNGIARRFSLKRFWGIRIKRSVVARRSSLHWVIVGGESGANARSMDPLWAKTIRDQCVRAGIPFFFKQWGGRTSKAGGRELDGRTWDEMPIQSSAIPLVDRVPQIALAAQSLRA